MTDAGGGAVGTMRVDAHVATDCGRVKPNNEDCGAAAFANRLLVVADGMGGGAAGEYASRQAVAQIREVVAQAKFYQDGVGVREEGDGRAIGGKGLEAAVQHANTFLHSMSRTQEALKGMGTTAVCCLVEGRTAYFANVGDSRGYLFRRGVLSQITRDHSLFSDPKCDKSNVITRALGRKSYAEVDVFETTLEDGDVILLASDGLDKVVPDELIAAELGRFDDALAVVAGRLVDHANQAGGPDNITALVARVGAAEADPTARETSGARLAVKPSGGVRLSGVRSTAPAAAAPAPAPPSPAVITDRMVRPGRRGPWARLALATVVVAAVAAAVAVALSGRSAQTSTVAFAIEILARADEPPVGARLTVTAADGVVAWDATLAPDPSGWVLAVAQPRPLRSDHRLSAGQVGQLPAPADITGSHRLTVTPAPDQAGLVAVAGQPLAGLWDGQLHAYRIQLATVAWRQGEVEVWEGYVGGGPERGRVARDAFLAALPSGSGRDAAAAFADEVERRWSAARAIGAEVDRLLGSDQAVDRAELERRWGELERAAAHLDRLRPDGAAASGGRLEVLAAAAGRRAEVEQGEGEVAKVVAELRGLVAQGAAAPPQALRDAARRVEEALARARLAPLPAEAALVREASELAGTAPGGVGPSPVR